MPSRRAITCPGIDDLNLFFLHPSFASLTHSSQVKGANYDARPDTRQAGFCGPGIQKKPLVKRRDPKISQASFIHRFDLLRRLFDSVDGRNPAPLGMEKKLTVNKLPINWCRISSITSICASMGLGVSFIILVPQDIIQSLYLPQTKYITLLLSLSNRTPMENLPQVSTPPLTLFFLRCLVPQISLEFNFSFMCSFGYFQSSKTNKTYVHSSKKQTNQPPYLLCKIYIYNYFCFMDSHLLTKPTTRM